MTIYYIKWWEIWDKYTEMPKYTKRWNLKISRKISIKFYKQKLLMHPLEYLELRIKIENLITEAEKALSIPKYLSALIILFQNKMKVWKTHRSMRSSYIDL